MKTKLVRNLGVAAFRRLIRNPPVEPQLILITPELAYEALTYHNETLGLNGGRQQRPLRPSLSREYQRRMTSGVWRETAQPIQFDRAGRLLDGQHRCDALLQADVAIPMWVFFGRPEEDFAVTDIGVMRSNGDVFAIHGVPNAKNAAAITRAVATLKHGSYSKGGGGGSVANVKTPAEAYQYYLSLGAEAVCLGVSVMAKFSAQGLPSPSVAGGIAVIIREQSGEEEAAKFFDDIASGSNLKPRAPEKKLRDYLLREGKSLNRDEVCYSIIAAWNAHRLRHRQYSIWKHGDPKPEIVR